MARPVVPRQKGRWQGRQLVSSQWVKESTANKLTTEQPTSDGLYGYFRWIGEIESHPYFAALGNYSQQIIVVPDYRLIVVTVADESGFDSTTEEFVTRSTTSSSGRSSSPESSPPGLRWRTFRLPGCASP